MVSALTDYAKEKQFRALSNIASDVKVNVIRGGKTTSTSIFDLLVGDILCLNYGDVLPADGILIAGEVSLKIIYLSS